jgi:hypothetical protein
MNWNKYKGIIILGTVAGSATGSMIAALLISPSWYIMIIAFFALIGFILLLMLTIAIIIDVQNENKKQNRINRPANWGWDKSIEQE